MPDLDRLNVLLTVLISMCVLAGLIAGWRAKIAPHLGSANRTWVAFRDTFLGREAINDTITGREIEPAQPAIGVRMAKLEETVATIGDQQRRLDNHEDRLVSLEQARVERVVTQAESAAMWSAVDRLHEVDPAQPERSDPPPAEETP